MIITCGNYNEALNILANAEKSTGGQTNPSDQLEIQIPYTGHRLVIDYTDSAHRSVSIFGLGCKYDVAKVWNDDEIIMDSIASALYSDNCSSVNSVLDYLVSTSYSVRKFTIKFQQAESESIVVDTSEKWCEDGMDSMCAGYVHVKVYITYRDEDDRENKIIDIKEWMNKHIQYDCELLV